MPRPRAVASPAVRATALPADALLRHYQRTDCWTDCFEVELPQSVSLAAFVLAFGHTPLFRLERRLLALAGAGSTSADVAALAQGQCDRMALWRVETRDETQLLMTVRGDQVRSWWQAEPGADGSTRLRFGSALLPLRPGRLHPGASGLPRWLHTLYSRALLRQTARRLCHPPAA